MARRADHSREELYEIAIQAARNIVDADGYRALTARNVADAIGYSPGTLYNVFANLDDMITHLNGRTLDTLYERLAPAGSAATPEEDLARLLDGYLSFLEEHPNLWNMLFEYSLPSHQQPPEWYARKVDKVLGLIEGALSPLFPEGEIEQKTHAARILWAGLHGICSLSDSGKLRIVTTQSVRAMAEGLVTNFVKGLRVTVGSNKQ